MTFIDAAYTHYINEDRIVRKKGFYNPEEQLRPYILYRYCWRGRTSASFLYAFHKNQFKKKLITWRNPI